MKNILNLYEGFFDDLDKLNQDKVNDEFGGINSQVYDEHDFILSQDKNPEFFEGLCYMCRKYYPNLPSNENGFTQEDLDKIIETYNNYNGFSYFENVTSLDELQYFHNLENIYFFSFYRCEKLKSIIFPENLKKIEYCAFGCTSSLKKIIIPENIEILNDLAFKNCSSLKKIIIPERFKDNMKYIFYEVNLTKVDIIYI